MHNTKGGVELTSRRELCASQFQPRASPPRANSRHLFHYESRGPGIWQFIVSRPPGHLQTMANLFHNHPVVISRRRSESRVSSSQTLSFWSKWRAFINHKRPIKTIEPFALSFFSRSDSFCDLFYEVLLSWNSYVYLNMATNNFVYWSDGLEVKFFAFLQPW